MAKITTSTHRNDKAATRAIEYRLLVSRAMTQRLHSPSLDAEQDFSHDLFLHWEFDQRMQARHEVHTQVCMFGQSWKTFVQDVISAEHEVQVLSPTRYEAPDIARAANATGPGKTRCHMPMNMTEEEIPEQEQECWKDLQDAHVDLLHFFGQSRKDNNAHQ